MEGNETVLPTVKFKEVATQTTLTLSDLNKLLSIFLDTQGKVSTQTKIAGDVANGRTTRASNVMTKQAVKEADHDYVIFNNCSNTVVKTEVDTDEYLPPMATVGKRKRGRPRKRSLSPDYAPTQKRKCGPKSSLKQFSCTDCPLSFEEADQLKMHEFEHMQVHLFNCEQCDDVFDTRSQLTKHMYYRHKTDFLCRDCSLYLQSKNELIEHILNHGKGNSFPCDFCLETYETQEELETHANVHDQRSKFLPKNTKNMKKKVCQTCGKRFICQAHLSRHEVIHTDRRPHKCTQCNRSFAKIGNLESHLARQHKPKVQKNFECNVCGANYDVLKQFNQHMRSHGNVKFKKERGRCQCSVCGMTFTQGYKLKMHMYSHGETKPHQCEVCSHRFLQNYDLRQHLQHMHSIGIDKNFVKSFKCESCPLTFFKQYHLTRHFKIVHSGIKNYPCEQCDKKYATAGSLKEHMKCHNDGPFQCKLCQKILRTNGNLARHMLLHREKVMPTVITCKVCNIGFFTQEDMSSHSVSHLEGSPFKCSLCELAFDRANKLKEHRHKNHDFILPLNCPRCDEIFTVHERLRFHLKTHNRPLICKVCKDRFFSRTDLQKHMLIHGQVLPPDKPFPNQVQFESISQDDFLAEHKTLLNPPLVCSYCDMCFLNKDLLRRHYMKRMCRRPRRCLECGKMTSNMRALHKHMRSHKKDKFKCDRCKQYYSKKGLELHSKTHKFGYNFGYRSKLESHQLLHQFKIIEEISETLVLNPAETNATGTETVYCQPKYEETIPSSEVYTSQVPFKCTVCFQEFLVLDDFIVHCQQHPEIQITVKTLDAKDISI